MCGVADTSASIEGVSVFTNSYFSFESTSCDDAFVKSPVRSSANVTRLRLPDSTADVQVIL